MTALESLVGQVVAGYRIEARLGEGGMGVVYRGVHPLDATLPRRALKIVRPELAGSGDARERFVKEAKALAALDHPHVVRFYDIRDEGGMLVMLLELLDPGSRGGSLAERLERDSPLRLRDALSWMQQACAGVAAAHRKGIVHRDLKPSNLYLHQGEEGLVVKVIDFGIAKATQTQSASTAGILGTPGYMAPERWQSGPPDKRADVYALGVSLYELLLGHHPYEPAGTRRSPPQMMYAHLVEPMPALEGVVPEVPPSLTEVMVRATAKIPEERYADASELAAALSSVQRAMGARTVRLEDVPAAQRSAPPEAPLDTPRTALLEQAAPPVVVHLPVMGSAREAWPTNLRIAAIVGALALASVGAVAAFEGAGREAGPTTEGGTTAVSDTSVAPTLEAPSASSTQAATAPQALNTWVPIAAAVPTERRVTDAWTDETRRVVSLPLLGLVRGQHQRGFAASRGITAPVTRYEIQAHEVTWAEIDSFLATLSEAERAALVVSPAELAWSDRAALPATGVPWDIAQRYCLSLSGNLPTEEQWEWAARGPSLRPHPWGAGRIDTDRTHTYQGTAGRVAPVATHDQDHTPNGLWDMAGNAMEWTVDLYREDAPRQDESWVQTAEASYRAVRGLPLAETPPREWPEASLAYRDALCAGGDCAAAAAVLLAQVGFRCVR